MNPGLHFHSLETQRFSRLVSTGRPRKMWTKTGRNSPMAGIKKRRSAAGSKSSRGGVANRPHGSAREEARVHSEKNR
jgi:hypothetical protein